MKGNGLDGPAKSVGALALLGAGLPLSVAMVALSGLRARMVGNSGEAIASQPSNERKTVLVSGAKMTKALVLARAFDRAGHRVILCESERYALNAHRFSNAAHAFRALPDSGSPSYARALKRVIHEFDVDVFVPVTSPAGSLHDSALVPDLSEVSEVLHVGPDLIDALDDKAQFSEIAARHELRTPKTIKVQSPDEVLAFDFSHEARPFILKSIAYDPVGRLDLTRLPMADTLAMDEYVRALPISAENPYVLQEFIEGTEYCTHGFFRSGELRVHCCCNSSPFQVNYDHIDKPAIRHWVEAFGQATGLTGQASFDFIEADDDGEIYAIECNPRTHSAITLFGEDDRLAGAYLDDGEAEPIEPRGDAQATYWTAHELWRLIDAFPSSPKLRERLAVLADGRDAVLDARDPLPFLALHHLHIPALLLRSMVEGRDWHRIDFNIGKLVQAGGD